MDLKESQDQSCDSNAAGNFYEVVISLKRGISGLNSSVKLCFHGSLQAFIEDGIGLKSTDL